MIDRKQLKTAGGLHKLAPQPPHYPVQYSLNYTLCHTLPQVGTILYMVYYTLCCIFSHCHKLARTTGAPTPPTGFNTLAGLSAFAAFDLSHLLWHFF